MRPILPRVEVPHEDEEGVLHYFMTTLPKIDPFAFMQELTTVYAVNRLIARAETEQEEWGQFPPYPNRPFGQVWYIGLVGQILSAYEWCIGGRL